LIVSRAAIRRAVCVLTRTHENHTHKLSSSHSFSPNLLLIQALLNLNGAIGDDDAVAVDDDAADDFGFEGAEDVTIDALSNIRELTAETLTQLKARVTAKPSLRNMRQLLRVFRSACHIGDEHDSANDQRRAVKIGDSKVFSNLMRFSLRHAGPLFQRMLDAGGGGSGGGDAKAVDETATKGGKGKKKMTKKQLKAVAAQKEKAALKRKENGGDDATDDTTTASTSLKTHARWRVMEPLLRSYLTNMLHFLRELVDPHMQRFVLATAAAVCPYFAPFPKLAQKFLKTLLEIWSSADEHARIDAFLVRRN
jgi:hypothetical protein